MAVEPGLVVPKQISMEAIMADLKDTIEKLGGQSLDKSKNRRDEKAKALERKANNKAIQYYESQKGVESGTKNDPIYQYLKRIFPQKHQKKLNKMYDKYLIKNKYYQFSLRALNTMVSLLKDNAGWFLKLLGFLALLAVFDPNGEFITSIINTLTDMFLWLIDTIIPMLPGIIDRMITLVPKIVNALIPAIEKIVSTIGKGLITAGQEQGGISGMFLQIAGYLTPVIAALGGLAKLFGGLGPVLDFMQIVFEGIWKIITFIKPVLGWIISALGAIVTAIASIVGLPVWLVAAIIAGIAAAGVLIYKYWDQIKDFLNMVGEAIYSFISGIPDAILNALGSFTNWLGGLQDTIDSFFISIGNMFWDYLIYPWVYSLQLIGDFIINGVVSIGTFIFDWVKNAVKILKRGFGSLANVIKAFIPKLLNFFSVENMLKLMKTGWKGFTDFINDIWEAIKSPFVWLADYLSGLLISLDSYLSKGKTVSVEQGRAIATLSRETGISQNRLADIARGKSDIRSLTAEEQRSMLKEGFDIKELTSALETIKGADNTKMENLLKQQLDIMAQSDPSSAAILSEKELAKYIK